MTKFTMTAEQIEAAKDTQEGRYAITMALDTFFRANGMNVNRSFTNGELVAEAHHWAKA